jgi:carbon-monoxide dehydrogenase large subunit
MPDTHLPAADFSVGRAVPRKEDTALLTGKGRFTDDIVLPGQAFGVFVRAQNAHGIVRGIDTEAAATMPGVRAVITAEALRAAGIGDLPHSLKLPNRDGSAMRHPTQPALAEMTVRFAGEPLALVVADTIPQARDAAEQVFADIEPLPCTVTSHDGVAPGAPLVHADFPGNVVLDFQHGNRHAAEAAFASAAHVSRLKLRNNRVVVCAMEPRAAIASYEDGRYVLRLGCQGVFGMRNQIAAAMGVPVSQVRVLSGNTGGSFGMKAGVYPEYVAMLHAAKTLGRPVKWRNDRSESFLSDNHGRDHDMEAAIALDGAGKILAVQVHGHGNLGAYLGFAGILPPTGNTAKNLPGVYATPVINVETKAVMTNTAPVGPYRGAGRPEGNYYMERLMDQAAAAMAIGPAELRRRNHITAFPHRAPSGALYDSGDFPALLAKALRLADWDGFAARKQQSAANGRLRGRGIGQYLEVTAPPANEMGGIRFEPDGSVTIVTGTLDYGQGHATPFAQILAARLGVPFENIRLLQGDSDELIAGGGTGGSKSLMASGAAIAEAAALVIEKASALAAQFLEAAPSDIEFSVDGEGGRFTIAGTDRSVTLTDLAAANPHALDVLHVHKGAPSAYPNGCHIAEVEVDPETGETFVARYSMVNDFGVVINPMLVEGQAHGGIVQGIGQALRESTHYDETGQLLTATFLDYALPRASDVPPIACLWHPVPATTNLLGAKGCGEAGCAGALPAVMNALADALRERGVTHIDMPATPEIVWQALRGAALAAQ